MSDTERLRAALEKIEKWAEAYPLKVFQEPDWERADAVLRDAGMSLTAISAANMRYVLQGVQKIAREALEAASSPSVPSSPTVKQMSELWAMHIEGPDDVLAAPSKEEAQKRADELNAWFEKKLKADPHPDNPIMTAKVIPWDYSAESHAKEVLKWNDPT